MKVAVVPADVEQLLVAYLAPLFPTADVGVVLPTDWAQDSAPFILVACDGVATGQWPVATRATVRVAVWAHSRSQAKLLAGMALGHLMTSDGTTFRAMSGSGVITTFDADSRADIASFTVRVDTRTQPLSA